MDINEESNFLSPLDPLDDLWPLYEGIFEQQRIDNQSNENIISPLLMGTIEDYCYNKEIDTLSTEMIVEQQHIETPQVALVGKGLKKTKMSSSISANSKKRKEIIRRNSTIIIGNKGKGVMLDGEEGQTSTSSLVAKKMDHNAKERIRRMKLNASYLALRSLLPDSRRAKKRSWSAPSTVDKVIKYIPELENEIEELVYKKEQLQSATSNKKIPNINDNNIENSANSQSPPTVSVHKVDEDEAIIQICMEAKEDGSNFTNLLQRVEDEGISINSASTQNVCENRTSSYLHIQTNRIPGGAENIAELRDKFISWLR